MKCGRSKCSLSIKPVQTINNWLARAPRKTSSRKFGVTPRLFDLHHIVACLLSAHAKSYFLLAFTSCRSFLLVVGARGALIDLHASIALRGRRAEVEYQGKRETHLRNQSIWDTTEVVISWRRTNGIAWLAKLRHRRQLAPQQRKPRHLWWIRLRRLGRALEHGECTEFDVESWRWNTGGGLGLYR